MQARALSAGHGIIWFTRGWQLFMQSPGLWILICFLFFLLSFFLSLVPLVSLLVTLFMPAVQGGILYSARELEAGRPMKVGYMFIAFKQEDKLIPMLTVGGIMLAASFVITIILVIAVIVLGISLSGTEGDLAATGQLPTTFLLIALVSLALFLPMLMFYWFAVPIIMFTDTPPLEAMRLSFQACLRNIIPMLLLGLILLLALFIAMLPLFIGLLVFMPLSFTSWYANYTDIFPEEESTDKIMTA